MDVIGAQPLRAGARAAAVPAAATRAQGAGTAASGGRLMRATMASMAGVTAAVAAAAVPRDEDLDLIAQVRSVKSTSITHRAPHEDTRANPEPKLGSKTVTTTPPGPSLLFEAAWDAERGVVVVTVTLAHCNVMLALLNAIREILDNCTDAFVRGVKGGSVDADGNWVLSDGRRVTPAISVTIDKATGTFVIHNNGDGFELAMVGDTPSVVTCYSTPKTSGNYHQQQAVIGCHGDGAKFAMHVCAGRAPDGVSGGFVVEGQGMIPANEATGAAARAAYFRAAFVDHHPPRALELFHERPSSLEDGFSGTRVTGHLDLEYFGLPDGIRDDDMRVIGGRVLLLALCYPGIAFTFNGQPVPTYTLSQLMRVVLPDAVSPFLTVQAAAARAEAAAAEAAAEAEAAAAAAHGDGGDGGDGGVEEAKGEVAPPPSTLVDGFGTQTRFGFGVQARLVLSTEAAATADEAEVAALAALPTWEVFLHALPPSDDRAQQRRFVRLLNGVCIYKGTVVAKLRAALAKLVFAALPDDVRGVVKMYEVVRELGAALELSFAAYVAAPRFANNLKQDARVDLSRYELQFQEAPAATANDGDDGGGTLAPFAERLFDLVGGLGVCRKLADIVELERAKARNAAQPRSRLPIVRHDDLQGIPNLLAAEGGTMQVLSLCEGTSAGTAMAAWRKALPTAAQTDAAIKALVALLPRLSWEFGSPTPQAVVTRLGYDPLQGLQRPGDWFFDDDYRLHATSSVARALRENYVKWVAHCASFSGNRRHWQSDRTPPRAHGAPDAMLHQSHTAIYTLRGKIPTAYHNGKAEARHRPKAGSVLEMVRRILGLQYGDTYGNSNLRAALVLGFTDGDDDGAHIMTLIVCFFATYWPWMLTNKMVGRFRAPVVATRDARHAFHSVTDYQWAMRQAAAAGDAALRRTLRDAAYLKGIGGFMDAQLVRLARQYNRFLVMYVHGGSEAQIKQLLHFHFGKEKQAVQERFDLKHARLLEDEAAGGTQDGEFQLVADRRRRMQAAVRAATRGRTRLAVNEEADLALTMEHLLDTYCNKAWERAIPYAVTGLAHARRHVFTYLLMHPREVVEHSNIMALMGKIADHSHYEHSPTSLGNTILTMVANAYGCGNDMMPIRAVGQPRNRDDSGNGAASRYMKVAVLPLFELLFPPKFTPLFTRREVADDKGEATGEFVDCSAILPLLFLLHIVGISKGTCAVFNPRSAGDVIAAVNDMIDAAERGAIAALGGGAAQGVLLTEAALEAAIAAAVAWCTPEHVPRMPPYFPGMHDMYGQTPLPEATAKMPRLLRKDNGWAHLGVLADGVAFGVAGPGHHHFECVKLRVLDLPMGVSTVSYLEFLTECKRGARRQAFLSTPTPRVARFTVVRRDPQRVIIDVWVPLALLPAQRAEGKRAIQAIDAQVKAHLASAESQAAVAAAVAERRATVEAASGVFTAEQEAEVAQSVADEQAEAKRRELVALVQARFDAATAPPDGTFRATLALYESLHLVTTHNLHDTAQRVMMPNHTVITLGSEAEYLRLWFPHMLRLYWRHHQQRLQALAATARTARLDAEFVRAVLDGRLQVIDRPDAEVRASIMRVLGEDAQSHIAHLRKLPNSDFSAEAPARFDAKSRAATEELAAARRTWVTEEWRADVQAVVQHIAARGIVAGQRLEDVDPQHRLDPRLLQRFAQAGQHFVTPSEVKLERRAAQRAARQAADSVKQAKRKRRLAAAAARKREREEAAATRKRAREEAAAARATQQRVKRPRRRQCSQPRAADDGGDSSSAYEPSDEEAEAVVEARAAPLRRRPRRRYTAIVSYAEPASDVDMIDDSDASIGAGAGADDDDDDDDDDVVFVGGGEAETDGDAVNADGASHDDEVNVGGAPDDGDEAEAEVDTDTATDDGAADDDDMVDADGGASDGAATHEDDEWWADDGCGPSELEFEDND